MFYHLDLIAYLGTHHSSKLAQLTCSISSFHPKERRVKEVKRLTRVTQLVDRRAKFQINANPLMTIALSLEGLVLVLVFVIGICSIELLPQYHPGLG
jgi:hypothetical protein